MPDKTLIMKEAQKYLAKGQVDRAIAEWEKLLKEAPDGNVFNIIGDLYLKKGDKNRAVESFHKAAGHFRAEGFSLKALALYKKILNINPQDADAMFCLGELSEEKGLVTDATKYYLAAADSLSKEGRKDKVLDVYRKILSLSPGNIPLRSKVAEIFIKEDLLSEAANEYLHLAALYEEKGDMPKAVEHFEKVLGFLPSNRGALLGISGFYERTGETAKARGYLQKALQLLPDDPDISIRYARLVAGTPEASSARVGLTKILAADPSNDEVRQMLADILLSEGELEEAWSAYLPIIDAMLAGGRESEAAALLERFREVDPIETGKRLVTAYRQIGDEPRTATELVILGDVLKDRGMAQQALDCYNDALAITPDDERIQASILEISYTGVGDIPETPVEDFPEETAVEEAVETPESPFEAAPEEIAETPEPQFSAETAEPETEAAPEAGQPGGSATSGEKTPEEIFIEADIFARYGLLSEAIKILEGLKMRAPQNIELHLRLKPLYVESGDRESAATECIILSELYKRNGDMARSEEMIQEALAIAPDDPRLEGRGMSSLIERTSYAQEVEQPAAAEPAASIEDYEEEIAEADFYVRQGLVQEAVKILERLRELFPDNKNVNERLNAVGMMHEMTGSAGMTGMFETMEHEGAGADSEDAAAEFISSYDLGTEHELSTEPEHILTPEPERELTPEPEHVLSPEPEHIIPPEPELMAEPEHILTPEPEHELAAEPPAVEEGVAGSPAETTEFEDFTFSAQDLMDAQEMPEPSLDNDVLEIFQEFKKGLEKELGDEDSETHYNLGIAYKEMGLVDDAIKEFQTSRSDPKRFVQSSTMLSVCYMDQGLYSLAVDTLLNILKEMTQQDESYWAVKYDLADAYEKNGNLREALDNFTAVYGWNARFRNVADRLGSLRPRAAAGVTPPPAEKDKPKQKKDRVSYL